MTKKNKNSDFFKDEVVNSFTNSESLEEDIGVLTEEELMVGIPDLTNDIIVEEDLKDDTIVFSNTEVKNCLKPNTQHTISFDIRTVHDEKIGVVVDCNLLNIRKAPSETSEILDRVGLSTELKIIEENSTKDWFAVCTAWGIDGFCMKKYIAIKQ